LNPSEKEWDELQDAYRKIHNIKDGEKFNIHDWIQKDPGIFSEHFDHRVKAMFEALQQKSGPFQGKLDKYWYRVEYQQRGAPHIHALLWLKDAPVIGKSDREEIMQFLNQYITCRLPDKITEERLYKLVTKYQMHTHSSLFKSYF